MNPRESNPDELSLSLHGNRAIGQAADAARKFGEAQRLEDDDLARLCIVIEELVANLYDHGGVTEREEVHLSMARDPVGVRVTISDPGSPFDPWSGPRAAESSARGGGAGLSLIQAWAVLIEYRSTDEANRLELLLPFNWAD